MINSLSTAPLEILRLPHPSLVELKMGVENSYCPIRWLNLDDDTVIHLRVIKSSGSRLEFNNEKGVIEESMNEMDWLIL